MKKEVLTYEEAHELLEYRDGALYWKHNGRRAGGFRGDNRDYRIIRVKGTLYYEHRLVFMMHNGYFPEYEVDHINRDRADNRIENLRHVTRLCNSRNLGISKRNKTGVTGIHLHTKLTNSFVVQIRSGGKKRHVGIYRGFDEAVMARWRAEVQHGFPNCNSSSSAYKYLVNNGLIPSGGASC